MRSGDAIDAATRPVQGEQASPRPDTAPTAAADRGGDDRHRRRWLPAGPRHRQHRQPRASHRTRTHRGVVITAPGVPAVTPTPRAGRRLYRQA
jgi:hypothetical protein